MQNPAEMLSALLKEPPMPSVPVMLGSIFDALLQGALRGLGVAALIKYLWL